MIERERERRKKERKTIIFYDQILAPMERSWVQNPLHSIVASTKLREDIYIYIDIAY